MRCHWKVVFAAFAIGLATGVVLMSRPDDRGRPRWVSFVLGSSPRDSTASGAGAVGEPPTARTPEVDAPAASPASPAQTAAYRASTAGLGAGATAGRILPVAPGPSAADGGAGFTSYDPAADPAPQAGASSGLPGSAPASPTVGASASRSAAGSAGGPKVVVYGSAGREHLMARGMPGPANLTGASAPAASSRRGKGGRGRGYGFGAGQGAGGGGSSSASSAGAGDSSGDGGAGDGFGPSAGAGSLGAGSASRAASGLSYGGAAQARGGLAGAAQGANAPKGRSQTTMQNAADQASQGLQQGRAILDVLANDKNLALPPGALQAIDGQFQNAQKQVRPPDSGGSDAVGAADSNGDSGGAGAKTPKKDDE